MTTSIFYDKRKMRKDGTYPIKITLRHANSSAHFPTDINIKPDEWDAALQSVKKRPDAMYLNNQIRDKCEEIYCYADSVLTRNEPGTRLTAAEIKHIILTEIATKKRKDAILQEGNGMMLLENYYAKIRREKTGRTGEIYDAALKWIKTYSGNYYHFLTLDEITPDWIYGLSAKMKDGGCKSADTRSMYLRCLRHVMTRAYNEEVINRNPFQRYEIEKEPIKNDEFLELDELCKLMTWPVEPYQRRYVDFFMLSFYLIGANPSDILDLTPKNIRNGNILTYRRNKTKKWYTVRLEPEALEIINRHRGKKMLLSWGERKNVKSFADAANRELKRIGVWKRSKVSKINRLQLEEALFPDITLYWARYTWAQLTDDIIGDFRIVEDGLGHAFKVTDRYVRRRQERVWDANRQLIDRINEKINNTVTNDSPDGVSGQ